MTTYTLSVTSKGTVTLPKKVRTKLKIDSKVRKVRMHFDEKTGQILFLPIMTLKDLTQSIQPRKTALSEDKFAEITKDEVASNYQGKFVKNSV